MGGTSRSAQNTFSPHLKESGKLLVQIFSSTGACLTMFAIPIAIEGIANTVGHERTKKEVSQLLYDDSWLLLVSGMNRLRKNPRGNIMEFA